MPVLANLVLSSSGSQYLVQPEEVPRELLSMATKWQERMLVADCRRYPRAPTSEPACEWTSPAERMTARGKCPRTTRLPS